MRNLFSLPETHNLNPEVVKHLRRNILTNILDAGFWYFGDSFVAAYTILPVFMSTLTDSPLLIGVIPALQGAGWFLPQLFFAKHLESQNRRLPTVLSLGIIERLSFLLLAIAVFFLLRVDRNVAIAIFLSIYAIKAFTSGMVALPWQELIATVIPVTHRGRYWGYSLILGKLMGMAGAMITGLILANIAYPKNYSLMFAIAFTSVSISYIFLSRNIEPEMKRETPSSDINTWGKITHILAADRNFRTYLLNRGFAFLSLMGIGFVAVYGIQKFDLSISYSATFTFVMFISEIVGYGIWGSIGDKDGYKRIIEYSNLLYLLGVLALLFVGSLWGLYVVFGIISLAHSGEYIADQNIAMEFGQEADRPTYIGMSKTLTGPFLLLAPIIGGTLVMFFGYQSMFLISAILSMVAFVIIKFFVVEPRPSS
ncbi:MAG: MFS transporter [Anaerolineales bacterium]|nr:MFS transporter [Anaerolineales bacterium]